MKNYIKWIILFVCLIMFCFMAVNVYNGNDFYSDGVIYDFVNDYFINDGMTNVVKIITWFGSTIGIIIMCLISLFVIRNKKINIILVINLICATLLNNYVLKLIFTRDRPNINPIVIENSYSFPSGHSMVSMVFYGSLIYIAYKYLNNKKLKWIIIFCLSVLILLIGLSRIYLGVHYFSDVMGGFIIGICYLIISTMVIRKIIKKI